MSTLRIKLLTKELNFLKDIFMAHAGSSHGITVDDMEMKSLLEDDEELDTGQDALLLDEEFVLNPPWYSDIPTPPPASQPSQASLDTPNEDDEKGQLRNSFYVGEIRDDIFNAFSSGNSPQPQKTDIQCVSKVTLHLPSKQTMQTSALLDTGSVLNFVSRALIEKLGSPQPGGSWSGSIKTISGVRAITTPFYAIAIRDINNGVNVIRALMVDSIGQSSNLDHNSFIQICEILKVNPALIQQPTGNVIHLLLGLSSLKLLGSPVTHIHDISAPSKFRKIKYPSPLFDNLRLFSSTLSQ